MDRISFKSNSMPKSYTIKECREVIEPMAAVCMQTLANSGQQDVQHIEMLPIEERLGHGRENTI